ncbi:MAG: cytochrome c biogenesis protein CcdA [Erysipelotrichaceae bacterium]|nr:cytochrome c biogenesis protein CcdA [Erysipelotrichaceae bacterium]
MDISLLAIFLEGVLSFLSPCVLPLLPLYMSYLAGENKTKDEDGNIRYQTVKVFITTLFFVLGIWLTFVILSLSVSFIGPFIEDYKEIIQAIGGALLIIFGLHELGLFNISVLNEEHKLKVNLNLSSMNYLKAFVLGFIFSLGWSPCIGPLLANAIMMATTESLGYLYLVAYGLGLSIPFLVTGLLTNAVLSFLEKNKSLFKWVLKISGIILICFGAYMIYNAANDIKTIKTADKEATVMDKEFYDHNDQKIILSKLKGNYVVLNFSTTWCTYCQAEIPEFENFSKNNNIKCFYVMSPIMEYTSDALDTYISSFNGDVPILIDEQGTLFNYCGVSSFPQTFIIDPDGDFISYYPGALDEEGFKGLLDYAIDLYSQKQ